MEDRAPYYSQAEADRLHQATQAARYLQQGAAEASLLKPLCPASYALQARFERDYQAAAVAENGYLKACLDAQRRSIGFQQQTR